MAATRSKYMEIVLDNAVPGVLMFQNELPRHMFGWTGQCGPTIAGRVIIKPQKRDIKLTDLNLTIKGNIAVNISKVNMEAVEQVRYHSQEAPMFEYSLQLLPPTPAKIPHVLLANKTYTYEFSWTLPFGLPNYTLTRFGRVFYNLRAFGNKAPASGFSKFLSDPHFETVQPFEVYHSVEPDNKLVLEPLSKTGVFVDMVKYQVTIPRRAFSFGSTIPITISMETCAASLGHTAVAQWKVKKCAIKLKQAIEFSAEQRTEDLRQQYIKEDQKQELKTWPIKENEPVKDKVLTFKMPEGDIEASVNLSQIKTSHILQLDFEMLVNGKSKDLKVMFMLYVPGPFDIGQGLAAVQPLISSREKLELNMLL